MDCFVLIDGNALVHRAYHALPKTLRSKAGELTNAVYGFTTIVLGILEMEKPRYFAAAFDSHGPTFRHAEMSAYKGTRAETDDELIGQFPRVEAVLNALSVPIFSKVGLEADDYLGIVSRIIEQRYPELNVLIVTNDQDALQLVSERVTVVAPVSGYSEVKRFNRQAVKDKLGVWPEQIPDYKGLSGDSSDNLVGVPGIGPKSAVKLLEQFGTVEGIYENLNAVESARTRALLLEHEHSARLCKKIATILREDHLDFSLDACAMHEFKIENVRKLFDELSFNTPLRRVEALNKEWEKRRTEAKQASLF